MIGSTNILKPTVGFSEAFSNSLFCLYTSFTASLLITRSGAVAFQSASLMLLYTQVV